MWENGFYVTLPSNASGKVFSENTSSAFTVQLARPLDLHGEWEVGLAEIQYPHTWRTIPKGGILKIFNEKETWTYAITGYYLNINEIVVRINTLIKREGDKGPKSELKYEPSERKVYLRAPTDFKMEAKGHLAHILGMQPGTPCISSDHPVDFTGGFNTLYVYTDIVEHQIVGDYYVQLLRTVPVRGSINERITITYDKPHYVGVNKDHVDTITVEIKTDQNKNVTFSYGKVVVKLHFRPRKRWYF